MRLRTLFQIFLVIFVLDGTCQGEICDPSGVICINCTDYQRCSGGTPTGPVFSCKGGVECGEEPLLEHCWTTLNCFGFNECTGVGIFPDAMVESRYFVCLPDSDGGFVKYDFACPDEEFFDGAAQMCVAKAVTKEATPMPSGESTTTVPSPDTTPSVPETTPGTTPSVPETTPDTTTPSVPETTPGTTLSVPETTPGTTPSVPETTPESTPGTTPSTPGTTPSTPGTTPSTPGTTPSTPGTTPSTPGTTPSTPGTTPTTPGTTPSTPGTTPTTPPPPFACTSPGIFPNPTNCKMYFRCSTSLKVFSFICPGTSYFNENILKCSLNITPACKEQILQNTTTTPAPTQPTTTTPVPTTTTTTPAPTQPTTTTPVPTTTTTTPAPTQPTTTISVPTQPPPTTAPPFTCPASGTYENPLDCKTYYRCSSSGKSFLYVCPGGSYYNEVTRRCGLTITPRCRSKLLL